MKITGIVPCTVQTTSARIKRVNYLVELTILVH